MPPSGRICSSIAQAPKRGRAQQRPASIDQMTNMDLPCRIDSSGIVVRKNVIGGHDGRHVILIRSVFGDVFVVARPFIVGRAGSVERLLQYPFPSEIPCLL